jgi:hypothetical protein
MADTTLIVGSVPLDVAVTIDGSAEAIEGNYYLRSATGALSLLTAFAAAMTAAGLASVAVTMRGNLRVRIAASSTFTVTWNSTELRDLLGFTGNLSGASSYTATNPSPLLWAPGSMATPTTIQGKAGYVVPHVTWHSRDDETGNETQHFGSGVWQELDWALVPTERLQVADNEDDGNTFEGLYRTVLQYGYRFHYHQSVDEESDATNELDWNDADAFGPYQLRSPLDPSWYKRLVDNADDYGAGVALELRRVEDYA